MFDTQSLLANRHLATQEKSLALVDPRYCNR